MVLKYEIITWKQKCKNTLGLKTIETISSFRET